MAPDIPSRYANNDERHRDRTRPNRSPRLEDDTVDDSERSYTSDVSDRGRETLRKRRWNSQPDGSTSPGHRQSSLHIFDTATQLQYDVIAKPENELEVQRMVNNHMVRLWSLENNHMYGTLDFGIGNMVYAGHGNLEILDF